jgi:3',5'-cyclic AMP phosphodiesterase CpdA
MTTLLVQLTDTHIREPGKLAYGRIDTAPYLREAVKSILRMKQPPAAVVMTGDLVDFGRPAEYAHLAELLEPLKIPVYLMPGNHDDRDALRRSFPGHTYLGTGEFLQYTVDIEGVRLLALDTSVPGRSEGMLCERRLAWLAQELQRSRGMRVIVAMHHPPFKTFIGHMDKIGLQSGSDELAALLAKHDHVQRVICGHLHRAIDARFGGTIASTSPSPAHQVCLDLSPDAPSMWTLEPPGFRVHVWDAEGPVVTHLAAIGDFPGPYPFHENGALID